MRNKPVQETKPAAPLPPAGSEAAAPSADSSPGEASASPAPLEKAPKEFEGKPQAFLSLCNIAGHAWEHKTTPRGHWTYAECKNPGCGKLTEIRAASNK